MEGLEIKIKKRLLTVSSLHLIFGRLKLLSDTNNIFYIFFRYFSPNCRDKTTII